MLRSVVAFWSAQGGDNDIVVYEDAAVMQHSAETHAFANCTGGSPPASRFWVAKSACGVWGHVFEAALLVDCGARQG